GGAARKRGVGGAGRRGGRGGQRSEDPPVARRPGFARFPEAALVDHPIATGTTARELGQSQGTDGGRLTPALRLLRDPQNILGTWIPTHNASIENGLTR